MSLASISRYTHSASPPINILSVSLYSNLQPEDKWTDCERPLIGITPIMELCRVHYGKEYAPMSLSCLITHNSQPRWEN